MHVAQVRELQMPAKMVKCEFINYNSVWSNDKPNASAHQWKAEK